jgi:probable rRNA maturation factor
MPTKMQSLLKTEIQYATSAIQQSLNAIASPVLIKKWVKAVTRHEGFITLRFVNQAEGKKLNLAFRNQDKATNVLTFPYALTKQSLTADIVICLPVIRKEAREQNKTLKSHLAHLIIHGCLHAQGLDHESEKEAHKMENAEIHFLKSLGFTNPYQPIE